MISQLKNQFGKDLYINIKPDHDNKIILKSNDDLNLIKGYINEIDLHENERRKRVDFLKKLTNIYIDKTLYKSIKSYKGNEIKYKESISNWQYNVFGDSQPHIIKSINEIPKQYPEISNGYLGIQGYNDEINIQSLFSGSGLDTRRASIPSWTIRNITGIFMSDGTNIVTGHRFELDMSDGKTTQIFYSDQCLVQQKLYAHQTMKSLLIHEIEVHFSSSNISSLFIHLSKSNKRDLSRNMQFLETPINDKNIKIKTGTTHKNDIYNHEQFIYAKYHVIPDEIEIFPSNHVQKFYYLLSINENKNISNEHFELGVNMMENGNKLYKIHTLAWKRIWSYSGVFIKSSDKYDIPLMTAQFLVMSNSPSFGRLDKYGSIGATGLGVSSNQGVGSGVLTSCNGRIEYTQELWMMNYLTIMNPESVKSILNKRIQQLSVAKRNAFNFGFDGARFPVITNELGEELCPKEICGNSHFPTGMVALSLKNYLMITGDKTMFTKDTGLGLLMEINSYWFSVLNQTQDAIFNLASNGPSLLFNETINSVFNIGLIKEILVAIPVLMHFLNEKYDPEFAIYMSHLQNVSDLITIPFVDTVEYNPPYKGFQTFIDHIDYPEGVMLRHPLSNLVGSDLRNAEFYDKWLIEKPTPMALSIVLIGNLENEFYKASFARLKQLLTFSDNKFKIWTNQTNLWSSQSSQSSVWNGSYIPAASSYIDFVIFGLFQLRIRNNGLFLNPKLIRNIQVMRLSCISYFGFKIKITVDNNGITLEIMKSDSTQQLGVKIVTNGSSHSLKDKLVFPLNSYLVIKRSGILPSG